MFQVDGFLKMRDKKSLPFVLVTNRHILFNGSVYFKTNSIAISKDDMKCDYDINILHAIRKK